MRTIMDDKDLKESLIRIQITGQHTADLLRELKADIKSFKDDHEQRIRALERGKYMLLGVVVVMQFIGFAALKTLFNQ